MTTLLPGDAAIGPAPDGYHRLQRSITLPPGDRTFERARAMLRAWGPQIGAGMRVVGEATPVVGDQAVLVTRVGGVIPMAAPIRVIVADFDGPDAAGFAYETLPGHPEEGREAFFISRTGDTVEFTVTAWSRPASWYARLGGPVTRIIQNRYTNKYLLAMTVRPH